jgi:hypothetical protein
MLVQDMHYDLKMKFNKVDSQKNRNLRVQEIDWLLNEAEQIFVKLVAYPRMFTHLGFEVNQRSIEDIRNIIEKEIITPTDLVVSFPQNYEYFLKGQALISKGKCFKKKASFIPIQYDDAESSTFHSSSFEWREIIGRFNSQGIKLLVEDFQVDSFTLFYLRKRNYICYPGGLASGSYTLPSGIILSENQSCELADITHTEIVDIAVMLAAGQIQTSDFQIKMSKLSVTQVL